jgi:hypothetical protein
MTDYVLNLDSDTWPALFVEAVNFAVVNLKQFNPMTYQLINKSGTGIAIADFGEADSALGRVIWDGDNRRPVAVVNQRLINTVVESGYFPGRDLLASVLAHELVHSADYESDMARLIKGETTAEKIERRVNQSVMKNRRFLSAGQCLLHAHQAGFKFPD